MKPAFCLCGHVESCCMWYVPDVLANSTTVAVRTSVTGWKAKVKIWREIQSKHPLPLYRPVCIGPLLTVKRLRPLRAKKSKIQTRLVVVLTKSLLRLV
jgi:hypothetical protein